MFSVLVVAEVVVVAKDDMGIVGVGSVGVISIGAASSVMGLETGIGLRGI